MDEKVTTAKPVMKRQLKSELHGLIGKYGTTYSRITLFLSADLPSFIAYLCAVWLWAEVYSRSNEETLYLANVLFAVSAALSGLLFAYASVLNSEDKVRPSIVRCGEGFLVTAILLIGVAVIKQAIVTLDKNASYSPFWLTLLARCLQISTSLAVILPLKVFAECSFAVCSILIHRLYYDRAKS
jgi:hypothetical protein